MGAGPRVRHTICGQVIQSKHRHDLMACKCLLDEKPNYIFVDGGDDYLRLGGLSYEIEVEQPDGTWKRLSDTMDENRWIAE